MCCSNARAKEREVHELEISLESSQRALSVLRLTQQPSDWVISREDVQLTQKLSRHGRMGRVVEGKFCDCNVAVKMIYNELLIHSSHNLELFEREMDIASRCRHP